ncbi:hypothetical protein EYF80_030111 [Liparis tanakae]|uniref:Uncharacterized protein n=1 Tax=Liparis tanakae TaxID=230148 RepID=A0A4Z2H2Q3_9TELE|nr:hypothetical protein EYF80_030111 [Liparis tanakae]
MAMRILDRKKMMAPAPSTPTMSTHTITGAVNRSSSRNSMLTTMAMSSPLRRENTTTTRGFILRIHGHDDAKSSKMRTPTSLALKPFTRSLMETDTRTSCVGYRLSAN